MTSLGPAAWRLQVEEEQDTDANDTIGAIIPAAAAQAADATPLDSNKVGNFSPPDVFKGPVTDARPSWLCASP